MNFFLCRSVQRVTPPSLPISVTPMRNWLCMVSVDLVGELQLWYSRFCLFNESHVRKEDHAMTGSAQDAPQRSFACRICTEPIFLETSKTDEHGRAVHEECYVRKTISRFRRRQHGSFSGLAQCDKVAVFSQASRD